MHIIIMLVVGLVVGALAKLIMPGKDPGGLIVTIILGLAGSFLAGTFGYYSGGRMTALIASVIGAVLLLVVYRAVFQRRA